MMKGERVKNRSDHAAESPQVFVNKNDARGDAAPAAAAEPKKTRKARKPRKKEVVVEETETETETDVAVDEEWPECAS